MSKKAKSLFITAVVYVIALVVAVVGSYQFLGLHQWLLVLIGHLFATVVVFIASQLYKNSSLYDPFGQLLLYQLQSMSLFGLNLLT